MSKQYWTSSAFFVDRKKYDVAIFSHFRLTDWSFCRAHCLLKPFRFMAELA